MEGQKVKKKLETKITTLISCVIVWELSQIQLLIQLGLKADWRPRLQLLSWNLTEEKKKGDLRKSAPNS